MLACGSSLAAIVTWAVALLPSYSTLSSSTVILPKDKSMRLARCARIASRTAMSDFSSDPQPTSANTSNNTAAMGNDRPQRKR